MPGAGAREVDDHPGDGDRVSTITAAVALAEQAEGDPRVLDVVDRERPDHLHLFVEAELAGDDVLRQLVGDDRGHGDRGQADPVLGARSQ